MKSVKILKALLSVMLMASVLLIACQPAAPAKVEPTAAPAKVEPTAAPAKVEPIKLGWLGALTGDMSHRGIPEKKSMIMTVEQINAAGGILGRPVEVTYYDGKGEQVEYINVIKRLIYEDKVVGIIGQNQSGNQIAMAPIAEEGKVPIIATYATNPRVTVPEPGKLMKYTFRVCFIDPFTGEVTAEFAYRDLGARKAAVFYDISSEYSTGVRDYFKTAWARLGGTIVAEEALKAGDVDFRPQLTKIKAANPDVLIAPYEFKEIALSTKQAKELGLKVTWIGGDGWRSTQLLEMAGDAVEGDYFLDHADVAAPNVAEFRKQYIARWGEEPEITSIMGHDALLVMKAAIEKAGVAEPTAIRDALENIKGVVVLSGTINMDPATHNPAGKAAVIIQILNGKFVYFKTFQP